MSRVNDLTVAVCLMQCNADNFRCAKILLRLSGLSKHCDSAASNPFSNSNQRVDGYVVVLRRISQGFHSKHLNLL